MADVAAPSVRSAGLPARTRRTPAHRRKAGRVSNVVLVLFAAVFLLPLTWLLAASFNADASYELTAPSTLTPETFRAGILAVDSGQTEAARSLGLSQWKSMKLVVLPQAIKNVLPALANEIVTMVKESSICMTLGMSELMFTAKNVASTTYISIAPYVVAAIIYFCINYPASKAIEAIERRMRRGDKV